MRAEPERARRIEIAHESLLTRWPRLVHWQAQDEEGALLRDQLRQAARLWHERGRPDDLLWTGTSLKEYELWRERYAGGLSSDEEVFAGAMTVKAAQRRRRRRLALGAVLLIAVTVAAVTTSLWRQARDQAVRAEASRLLALSEARAENAPTEAFAYAVASLELADSEEGRMAALRRLSVAPPAFEVVPGGADYAYPAFNPAGDRIALAGFGPEVRVLASGSGLPPVVLGDHPPRSSKWARWATDDLLVTEDGDFTRRIHLWRLPGGERVRTLDFGGPSFFQVGPGTLLVETYEEEGGRTLARLRSWSLPNGEAVEQGSVAWSELVGGRPNDPEEGGWRRRAFAPDGSAWLYARGTGVYFRSLPSESEAGDRLLGRHGAQVTDLAPLPGSPPRVWSRDRDGEIRIWKVAGRGAGLLRLTARPEAASVKRLPDPSGQWAVGGIGLGEDFDADLGARVWDLESWPEARPLVLRRNTSWYGATGAFDPRGQWLAVVTGRMSRLTLWPLRRAGPRVVDGYVGLYRPVEFSPDGRWLATDWSDGVRLWPLPGSDMPASRDLEGRLGVIDPRGRFLFTGRERPSIVPLDGSEPRVLEAPPTDNVHWAKAVSPSGDRVATAFGFGRGEKNLRIWDLGTGDLRLFDLPEGTIPDSTGYGRMVTTLAFADDRTLYTAGDGGVRRWDLATGEHELVLAARPGTYAELSLGSDRASAVVRSNITAGISEAEEDSSFLLLDLATGASRELQGYSTPVSWGFAYSGSVVVTGDAEGTIRVGSLSGGDPHLLLGHEGPVVSVAISPDHRWIASTGEDDTLRLWPMPNLQGPPLHRLPHDELLAVLRAQTNVRVVADPGSPGGWEVELAPFPGWKEIPTW